MMSDEENKALLQECPVGRIGTVSSDGAPYVTPVNYACDAETSRIYIHHSGKAGHLLANLKNSSRVCFEVDRPGAIVNISPCMPICDGDQVYRSVICFGQMCIANDEEKRCGLRLLGRKYIGRPASEQTTRFETAKLDRLVVLVIDIETMTGKCREPRSQSSLYQK
jgi:uncharacterized protein